MNENIMRKPVRTNERSDSVASVKFPNRREPAMELRPSTFVLRESLCPTVRYRAI